MTGVSTQDLRVAGTMRPRLGDPLPRLPDTHEPDLGEWKWSDWERYEWEGWVLIIGMQGADDKGRWEASATRTTDWVQAVEAGIDDLDGEDPTAPPNPYHPVLGHESGVRTWFSDRWVRVPAGPSRAVAVREEVQTFLDDLGDWARFDGSWHVESDTITMFAGRGDREPRPAELQLFVIPRGERKRKPSWSAVDRLLDLDSRDVDAGGGLSGLAAPLLAMEHVEQQVHGDDELLMATTEADEPTPDLLDALRALLAEARTQRAWVFEAHTCDIFGDEEFEEWWDDVTEGRES